MYKRTRYLNILMIFAYLLAGLIFLNKLEIGEYHLFNLENDNNYELMRLFIGGMMGFGIIIQTIIIGVERISSHKYSKIILLFLSLVHFIGIETGARQINNLKNLLLRFEEFEAASATRITGYVFYIIAIMNVFYVFLMLICVIRKDTSTNKDVNEQQGELEVSIFNYDASKYKTEVEWDKVVVFARIVLIITSISIFWASAFGGLFLHSAFPKYYYYGILLYAWPMLFVFELIVKRWITKGEWIRASVCWLIYAYHIYMSVVYVMPTCYMYHLIKVILPEFLFDPFRDFTIFFVVLAVILIVFLVLPAFVMVFCGVKKRVMCLK